MNGLERIATVFSTARREQRAALMPFFPLGFPDKSTSLEVILEIARAGADLIELGLPFSDPLADGPTIQRSTQIALENGITTYVCLEMVQQIRQKGVIQPLLLMGYYNPILNYGEEAFTTEACAAGADGLIVPDLPVEEAGPLEAACARLGMALVFLAAPTTPPGRLVHVAAHSHGFVYTVSLTGVTGARGQLAEGLEEFLGRMRAVTDKPLAVGFGISTPEQAAHVGKLADGIIVGSALIEEVQKAQEPAKAGGGYVRALREAMFR